MTHAIYARVSTDDQSTVSQLDQCRAWAFNQKMAVEMYEDDGVSGAQVSRPALDRMVADCRAGRIRTVIVYSLDRLGRSIQHLVNLIAELKRLNVAVVAVSQGIDTRDSNPTATLQLHVLAAFAEFERAIITERVRAGVKSAKARGVRFGRTPVTQTAEQARAVAEHHVLHGTTKQRLLGRALGINHGLAGRWLKALEPSPEAVV